VTGILDLDSGRLVDVLPGRSADAVTASLASKPAPRLSGIRHVVIDAFQPYATAVAAGLPDARLVVDHFHVIRLANAALDEVRLCLQPAGAGWRVRTLRREPPTSSTHGSNAPTTSITAPTMSAVVRAVDSGAGEQCQPTTMHPKAMTNRRAMLG
jgi:transposase